jgi:hypothetical protein
VPHVREPLRHLPRQPMVGRSAALNHVVRDRSVLVSRQRESTRDASSGGGATRYHWYTASRTICIRCTTTSTAAAATGAAATSGAAAASTGTAWHRCHAQHCVVVEPFDDRFGRCDLGTDQQHVNGLVERERVCVH